MSDVCSASVIQLDNTVRGGRRSIIDYSCIIDLRTILNLTDQLELSSITKRIDRWKSSDPIGCRSRMIHGDLRTTRVFGMSQINLNFDPLRSALIVGNPQTLWVPVNNDPWRSSDYCTRVFGMSQINFSFHPFNTNWSLEILRPFLDLMGNTKLVSIPLRWDFHKTFRSRSIS